MKKLLAILLAFTLAAASFAGCGKNYENVLVIDGENIPAGIYLIAQLEAYALAEQECGTETPLEETIDEVSGAQWVYNKTVELCRRYVYVERLYAEMGLGMSEEEEADLEKNIAANWQSYKEYYEANGVGEASYRLYSISYTKTNMLFEALYMAEGAEREVSNEDAMAYMDERYVYMSYIVLPAINYTTYQPLDETALAAVQAVGDDMVKALNEGAQVSDVITQYLPVAYSIVGSESLDVSTPDNFFAGSFIDKNSTDYDAAFTASLFDIPYGTFGLYRASEYFFWVARRSPNYTGEEEFELYRESIIFSMANEEFYAELEAKSAVYEVSEVAGAVAYYSPKNIVDQH